MLLTEFVRISSSIPTAVVGRVTIVPLFEKAGIRSERLICWGS